jgi:predicted transcriptional regulator of viral defense system
VNGERRLATGPQEARVLTELERRGISILALPRDPSFLPDLPDGHFRKLVHTLRTKGWLLPIERGKYLVAPRAAVGTWGEHPFVVAAGIAPGDYYISYWSALSHHRLTEQVPRIVYTALCGRRKREVRFQGWRYRFVTLSPAKCYGHAPAEFTALNGAARVEVEIAEPEKGILDSLDEEQLAGGFPEIVKALQRGFQNGVLTGSRLVDYAQRYPNATVAVRLGYVLQRLGRPEADVLRPIAERLKHPTFLSLRAGREAARFDPAWRLNVNVSDGVFEPLAVA